MLENHSRRIEADAMMVVSLDETSIADTLHPDAFGKPFDHPWLIDRALNDEFGEATGILYVDGEPLQFIVLPLFAPLHEAWIAIGFRLDDAFAESLKSFSMADLSLLVMVADQRSVHASTLDEQYRRVLARSMPDDPPSNAFEVELGRRPYLSLVLPLTAENDMPLYALMQRPLDEILEPYRELQTLLGVLFLFGLLATGIGAGALARGVSTPLTQLTQGARRIASGDYVQRVELDRRDELGELAGAFNEMAHGLAERDRVRNLLGMVVSPQIAEELMSREIALGGEERDVTVMFADCRGFTAMSEALPPAEVLRRLNEMLTVLTEVIERHGGVVDKYIGDAIMALFGAPLAHADDPSRAVACALEMIEAMDTLNRSRPEAERQAIGIGINSGRAVAGNMGSTTRLNYTVIGDTVNLASRVEALTRNYDAPVLVTEQTREACGATFEFELVDRVQVKGREAPVAIYTPRRRQSNSSS
jgi:adenylate cyclase